MSTAGGFHARSVRREQHPRGGRLDGRPAVLVRKDDHAEETKPPAGHAAGLGDSRSGDDSPRLRGAHQRQRLGRQGPRADDPKRSRWEHPRENGCPGDHHRAARRGRAPQGRGQADWHPRTLRQGGDRQCPRCPRPRRHPELLRSRAQLALQPAAPQVRRRAARSHARQTPTTWASTSRSPFPIRRRTRAPTTTRSSSASTPRRCTPISSPPRCAATGRPTPRIATVSKFNYLGPLIIANKGRPVRVKFTNKLPTGTGGNLFLPVDTTIMGAGMGPKRMNTTPGWPMNYTQNRGTIHLHGGHTVWISDGTQNQWITPAGENTNYPRGREREERAGHAQPGPRLADLLLLQRPERAAALLPRPCLRYHAAQRVRRRGRRLPADRRHGAGRSSAGRILEGLGVGTPLIIQDKTWLPNAATVAANDPTWPFAIDASKSNLWWPHVYMPNQNPNDLQASSTRWVVGTTAPGSSRRGP